MENQKMNQDEILELIINNPENLIEQLEEYHFFDIAGIIPLLTPNQTRIFFSSIDFDTSASIFEYLDEEETEELIKYLPETKIIKIIENMDIDKAVDLLKHLSHEGLRLLKKIPVSKRKALMKLMAYEESEIGAFISDSYLIIDESYSVKQAMRLVTESAHEVDYISIIYVLKDSKLSGYLKLKDLIVARANERIVDIMEKRYPTVLPHDDIEAVAQIMNETNESSIPVINAEGYLQGIITHDDLMDIVAKTEEEDYTKFAAVSAIDIDIQQSNLRDSVKSRLPWLTILLFLSLLTSIILSIFQGKLDDTDGAILLASKLAVYLPLILGMAGNTGTQSLAVMIRYLTKNEGIDHANIRKHLLREIKTGFLQGLIIGCLVFVMIIISTLLTEANINNTNLIYAIVTGASIFIALFVSTILGALIPLFMNRLNMDPAVASGPFITTVSDIITLTIYYSVSLIILLPLF